MKHIYLLFTFLGAIIPLAALIPWFELHGFNLVLLIQTIIESKVSLFAWLDVLISGIVLILFILVDAKKTRVARAYLAVISTLCIGVSCGLPLYLYLRTVTLEAKEDR